MTDDYEKHGFQLSYDEEDTLDFIEAFPPCAPTFQGIELLGDLQAVLGQLAALGHNSRYDNELYFFDDLGFALFAPMQTVEAVSVFRRDYFD